MGKCSPISPNPLTLVVPNYLATNDYNFGGGTLIQVLRSQEVYGAAEFPTNPIVITELRFRPNNINVSPLTTTISNLEVHLSTTRAHWNQLNNTFATNVGANDTIVFQGPLNISSAVTGPVGGPEDFDIIVPLTTPFVYNPAAGNLLLDIRNYNGTGSIVAGLSGSASSSDDCSRSVAVGDPNSATTSFQDSGVDALEVIYQPTNVTSLDQGLVANYPFDDNANDASGNHNDGVVYGATLTTNIFGAANTAYAFNGDQEYILAADSPSLEITNRLTVCTWINFGAGGTDNPRIISKTLVNGFELFTWGASNQRQIGFLTYADATILTSVQYINAGDWAYITATFDGTNKNLYVNGILDASVAASCVFTNSGQLTIGQNANNGQDNYVGLIDNVRIYNRALSPSEVSRLYAVESPTNVAVVAAVITQQPQSRTNLMGTTATFTVAATGTAPLNYQWSQNGTNLLNATNAILTLTNVQPGQADNYSVRISNIAGFTNSIAAVLTVLMPSQNTLKLVVPNYLATNDYNFGGGTLIQVLRSQEVYGAAEFPTNPIVITELRFRPNNINVSPFSTTISNLEVHLSTTSAHWNQLNNTFATNVGANDTIVFQGPLNISSAVTGPVGGPKDFDIIVPLTTPFVYNPAAGNLLLDIRNYNGTGSIVAGLSGSASSSDDCSRSVAVGDPNSATTSFQDSGVDALEVIYQPPVVITQQPLNQTNIAGMTAMFTVGATSLNPLTYQWQKNGTNLTNGGRISGATGTTLTIANVSTTDTANYRVMASNSFFSTVSSNAILKVLDVHSAIVTPTVINGFVVGVNLVDGGYGYANAPKVRLIGGGGSGAQLVAVISNGVVTAVNVISAGSGYTNNPIVVIDPPVIPNPVLAITPMSFLAFSNLTVSGAYQLQQAVAWYWTNLPVSFTATNAFYGKLVAGVAHNGDYRLALTPVPTQAFATPQLLNGFVVGATITSGGSGYITTPVVTITGGGGSNAMAMAHISGGVVTSISISNAGVGYTNTPTIQIAQPPAAAISPAVQPVMRVDSSQLATYENYQIQFTPNLDTPWKNWDGGLFTPTNATNSQFLFVTNGTGFFQLIYAP